MLAASTTTQSCANPEFPVSAERPRFSAPALGEALAKPAGAQGDRASSPNPNLNNDQQVLRSIGPNGRSLGTQRLPGLIDREQRAIGDAQGDNPRTMTTPPVRPSFICCLPFAASAGGAR